jgi:hypothetical protein
LFNLYEFGRKSFVSIEEDAGVDSYSSRFGRAGAVVLALAMAACACVLASAARGQVLVAGWALATLLSIVATLYSIADRPLFGRLFRAATAAYIVLFYAGLGLAQRVAEVHS